MVASSPEANAMQGASAILAGSSFARLDETSRSLTVERAGMRLNRGLNGNGSLCKSARKHYALETHVMRTAPRRRILGGEHFLTLGDRAGLPSTDGLLAGSVFRGMNTVRSDLLYHSIDVLGTVWVCRRRCVAGTDRTVASVRPCTSVSCS